MIKLIASDMDGTLLDNEKKLNSEIYEVIEKLEKENIQFVVSSGRQYHNLVELFGDYKDRVYYISENGNLIVDNKGNEIYSNSFSKEIVKDFIEITRTIPNAALLLSGKKACYIENPMKGLLVGLEEGFNSCKIVDDLLEVEDDIIRIEVYHQKNAKENALKYFQKYEDELQIMAIYDNWLEISNNGVSKGSAVRKLQEILDISPKETMVFGDYYNDIEMLQGSYYSYAMENATDDVKKYARFIAKRNSENGVIDKIKEIIC